MYIFYNIQNEYFCYYYYYTRTIILLINYSLFYAIICWFHFKSIKSQLIPFALFKGNQKEADASGNVSNASFCFSSEVQCNRQKGKHFLLPYWERERFNEQESLLKHVKIPPFRPLFHRWMKANGECQTQQWTRFFFFSPLWNVHNGSIKQLLHTLACCKRATKDEIKDYDYHYVTTHTGDIAQHISHLLPTSEHF